MYYRISGAPFTVRNAEEKKEFIDTINADSNFTRHLVCRGVDAEQFTGKVNGVVVCEKDMPSKVYVFKCDGNFPTLKLYQRTSSVVYVIEFPVNKVVQEPVAAVEQVEEPVEQEVPQVEEVVENVVEPAAEFEIPEEVVVVNTFEQPEETIVVDDENIVIQEAEETPEAPAEENPQPKPKRRGRKKKS